MTYERLPYDDASSSHRDDLRRGLRPPGAVARARGGPPGAEHPLRRLPARRARSRPSRCPRRPPGSPRRSTPTWTDPRPASRGMLERMTPGTGRWLAPLGASAAVLAVFVVPGVVAATGTSRAGVGPQQPEPGLHAVRPGHPAPAAGPEAEQDRSGPPLVDVVGYRVQGRDLRGVLHRRPERRLLGRDREAAWSRSGAAPSGSPAPAEAGRVRRGLRQPDPHQLGRHHARAPLGGGCSRTARAAGRWSRRSPSLP